jgi:adenylate cyclase class 2
VNDQCWEVELKFHVDDPNRLENRLVELGFQQTASEQHQDTYLRHPCRDFKSTDEAFRIRRINQAACFTYKGPRQSTSVKIREEIELPIDAAQIVQWQTLVERLGFTTLPPVRKLRRVFVSNMDRYKAFTVVMDEVQQLGSFAEVEQIVTSQQSLEAARLAVTQLAGLLGLSDPEPRSYLDQLLQQMGIA